MENGNNSTSLIPLLQSAFGFSCFRANQQEVCEAAVGGEDLLLVMPTGAGKSLCYQLPALARGGTALVISPLIALMEDQAAKLTSLGLRVARIHSGLERGMARQACVEYLQGSLQFLFIAPERLRVPGFTQMLKKGKLALIAIDEAHCISQWGHDFRPDYRTLGQYLPELRGSTGAPVLAMTATATPRVQSDIVAQLGLRQPTLFIHGFRRINLAIEVVEVPVPQRAAVIRKLLAKKEHRPAIVYATSRKQAERLAEELSQGPAGGVSHKRPAAAAYHAGLDAEMRERVQSAFQSGSLEVVVATIAFGMGIDKADIRTVIHAGLPGTLEGYYQEIGRAGRDGAMSRTFLMHSYADQRTHDFLLNRDYPPAEHLAEVFRVLGPDPRGVEEVRTTSKLSEEEFDKALEKLQVHGGARVDFDNTVTRGGMEWKRTYGVQAQFRVDEFAKVVDFTQQGDCRMCALVRHFGDVEDGNRPCGVCDVCDPAGAVLRRFRRATVVELQLAEKIMEELRGAEYKASGSLQRKLDPGESLGREAFDGILGAMVQAGMIEIESADFEKDGQVLKFRKVRLTEQAAAKNYQQRFDLLISNGVADEFDDLSVAAKAKKAKLEGAARAGNGSRNSPPSERPMEFSAESEALAMRIREWRAAEAKRLRVPAFVVLHDRTLSAVALARPRNTRELMTIDGIGPAKVERFGADLLRLCGEA